MACVNPTVCPTEAPTENVTSLLPDNYSPWRTSVEIETGVKVSFNIISWFHFWRSSFLSILHKLHWKCYSYCHNFITVIFEDISINLSITYVMITGIYIYTSNLLKVFLFLINDRKNIFWTFSIDNSKVLFFPV